MTRGTAVIGYSIVALVAAAITAMAFMPLSLALSLANVPILAERVEGTVWNGRLQNAWVSGYPLGTVHVSARALPLLRGRVGADVMVDGPVVRGRAFLGVGTGGETFVLRSAALDLSIQPLGFTDAFGAPMAGRIQAKSDRITLRDGQCVDGALQVATDTLAVSARRIGGEGFVLRGNGRCEAGAMVLPLAGEGTEGSAEVQVRVSNTSYTTEMAVVPRSPELAEALAFFGFEEQAGIYRWYLRGEIEL